MITALSLLEEESRLMTSRSRFTLHPSFMNNNPEEARTLGHLLVTVSLIEKDMEEEIVCQPVLGLTLGLKVLDVPRIISPFP